LIVFRRSGAPSDNGSCMDERHRSRIGSGAAHNPPRAIPVREADGPGRALQSPSVSSCPPVCAREGASRSDGSALMGFVDVAAIRRDTRHSARTSPAESANTGVPGVTSSR
jgi:hypothetical protein